MALKDIFNKVKKEIAVVKGDATKDKVYTNENTYSDETIARKEFERSKEKLYNVNRWTELEGINSTFELFDEQGRKTSSTKPALGYFIKIILPASGIENWVKITGIKEEADSAEFVVHPSEKPTPDPENENEIKHFFIKEASSTFKVERQGTKLIGYEIGRNEGINNQGEEAGDRALLNTLVAEGGWAGIQALQWDKLTSYLVHLEEAAPDAE
jgi:hypothetical protein